MEVKTAIEEKLNPVSVECSVVEPNKPFRRLTDAEIGQFIGKLGDAIPEKSE